MSFLEAAAIPYVGLTTWAAIRVTGAFSNLNGKRFLVLGGSGGVGTFAVQYLKSQGTHVCIINVLNIQKYKMEICTCQYNV